MDSSVNGRAAISVPVESAWQQLRDLRNCIHWVPGLERVEITTTQREGVGASRRVFAARGPGSDGMDETVTAWTEGRGFAIRLHRGEQGPPAPMREAEFVYTVHPDGADSRIETEMRYSLRWGVLGRAIDAAVTRRVFRSMAQQVAEGFARRAKETGAA